MLENPHLTDYQIIYSMTFVMLLVSGSIKGFGFARQLVLASSRMHDTMFRRVWHENQNFPMYNVK